MNKIKAAILSHGNLFSTEGDQLQHLITHAYIPDEYVSLGAPVKKQNNTNYLSDNKKSSVKIFDTTLDLK